MIHQQIVEYKCLFFLFNRTCRPLQVYAKKYKLNIPIFDDDDNNHNHHIKNATKNLDYSIMENRTACFYLLHIYKIRINDNSSLVIDSLGSWCPGLSFIKLPVSHLPLFINKMHNNLMNHQENKLKNDKLYVYSI